MQNRSFKFVSLLTLFFFLASPLSAFAQCPGGVCPIGGNNNRFGAGLLGGGLGGQDGGLGAGLAIGALALGGGGFGGGAGGGAGATGSVGQVLTLVGALTGNMGLLIAGMITSMIGGLTGGATPQRGAVDEGYVNQGAGFGSGGGGGVYNPYYPTPTPAPSQGPTPTPAAAACSASLFVVKDTTVTPNIAKPFPATVSVAQNDCVLAINSDSASHTVQVKRQGDSAVAADQAISGANSQIFRFSTKNTYTMCVDASSSACATVTVQ